MGLGKSMQALVFLHTVMSHYIHLGVRTALILCPLSITSNWQNECNQWLSSTEFKVSIYNFSEVRKGSEVEALKKWRETGGIGILHYDAAAGYVEEQKPKSGKKTKAELSGGGQILENGGGTEGENVISKATVSKKTEVIQDLLLNVPDILVCDEGRF